jgi:ADP-ribosylglycohydrolase
MNDKTRGMVLASFVADALALGVHWIYNTHVIDKKWGQIEGYIKPERPTYHPTKDLGEFTHYGDQTMVLLKSVAQCSGFDLEDFSERWRQFFKTYDGYFDDATKETLKNFAAGKGPTESGAGSQDLAGAARIAPLAYCYQKDLDGFITAARAQTALTHNSPQVIESAEYFGRVVWKVLRGETPTAAMAQIKNKGFNRAPYAGWVENGLQSIEMDTGRQLKSSGRCVKLPPPFLPWCT